MVVVQLIMLSFCHVSLYERYAVIVVNTGVVLDRNAAELIIKEISFHFKQQKFVLVMHRINNHRVSVDFYKSKALRNVKGFAIVSSDTRELKRAETEQLYWPKSFTFFTEQQEANNWAQNFFR